MLPTNLPKRRQARPKIFRRADVALLRVRSRFSLKKKPKIVFVCLVGNVGSFMRLSQFKDFLKRKKILTQFELSRIGYAEPGFESAVKKADLVISVYKETTELIQKILGKNAGQKIVECEKYGGNLFKDESEKMWPEILQKITQKK